MPHGLHVPVKGIHFCLLKQDAGHLAEEKYGLKGVIIRKMKVLSNHLVGGHGAQSHVG